MYLSSLITSLSSAFGLFSSFSFAYSFSKAPLMMCKHNSLIFFSSFLFSSFAFKSSEIDFCLWGSSVFWQWVSTPRLYGRKCSGSDSSCGAWISFLISLFWTWKDFIMIYPCMIYQHLFKSSWSSWHALASNGVNQANC